MENERLLSEQEIVKIWVTRQEGHYTCGDCRDLLITNQDRKTTAALIAQEFEYLDKISVTAYSAEDKNTISNFIKLFKKELGL